MKYSNFDATVFNIIQLPSQTLTLSPSIHKFDYELIYSGLSAE